MHRFVAASLMVGAIGVGMAAGGSAPLVGAQEAVENDFSFENDTAVLEAYGWWNKAQQTPPGAPPAPPPPDAPDNGLFLAHDVVTSDAPTPVAGAPGLVETLPGTVAGSVGAPAPTINLPEPIGPVAFGAVRYSVPEGAEGELTLHLDRPPSAAPAVVPVVLACPILSSWEGLPNAPYEQAPDYECASAAPGVLAGETITFVLPATLSSDLETFDLAIVPAGDHPFRMSLAAPNDESLRLTSVPESADDERDFDESFEDPAAGLDADLGSDGDFDAEDFGAFDEGTLEEGSFDDGSSPDSVTSWRPGGEVALPAGNVLNPFDPDKSRNDRILAVALLMAIGAGLWWAAGKPARAPRLLGSMGAGSRAIAAPPDGTERGIGRFSRLRITKRPPRLF